MDTNSKMQGELEAGLLMDGKRPRIDLIPSLIPA
jgi:hypothetical protein